MNSCFTFIQGVPKKHFDIMASIFEIWENMRKGNFEGIEEREKPFYELMTEYLVKERKRLGGNWAIAHTIFSRTQREFLCQKLGSELVFIVMNMSADCQRKRIEGRHGKAIGKEFVEILCKYAEMCEPAGDDEENAYNLDITEDMTKDDVMEKVYEIIQKC